LDDYEVERARIALAGKLDEVTPLAA